MIKAVFDGRKVKKRYVPRDQKRYDPVHGEKS